MLRGYARRLEKQLFGKGRLKGGPTSPLVFGLCAGNEGYLIVPWTNSSEEMDHGILNLATGTNLCGLDGPVRSAEDSELPQQGGAALPAVARSVGTPLCSLDLCGHQCRRQRERERHDALRCRPGRERRHHPDYPRAARNP